MLFKKRRPGPAVVFDPDRYTPVLRCSICTGEQTAGFADKETGSFHEIMLIRNEQDLAEFKDTYGVEDIRKCY